MSENWWESAPLAEQPQVHSANWWESAPLAEQPPEAQSAPEPSSFLRRFGQGVVDPIEAGAQGVTNAMDWLGIPRPEAIGGGSWADRQRQFTQDETKDYVAPEGIDWARMGGQMVATALPATKAAQAVSGGLKMIPGAVGKFFQGGLPTAATATMGKTAGRVLPRLAESPLTGGAAGAAGAAALGENPLEGAKWGAALGIPGTGVGMGLGWAGNHVANIIQELIAGAKGQAVQALRNIFNARAPIAAQAARSAQPYLPDEAVTVGQLRTPQLPELAAIEAEARKGTQVSLLTQADARTADARQRALRSISRGTEPRMNQNTGEPLPSVTAEARDNATRSGYRRTAPTQVEATPDLVELLDSDPVGPWVRDVMRKFRYDSLMAAAKGERPPFPGAVDATGARTHYSLDELGRMKDKFGEYLNHENYGKQAKEAREYVLNQMRDASPEYGDTHDLFRQMSVPQNQGDVATVLANKLRTGPRAFEAQMNDEQGLLRAAGVDDYTKSLPQLFGGPNTPGMDTLNRVRASVGRDINYMDAEKHSGMIPKVEAPTAKIEKATPRLLKSSLTLLRGALGPLGRAGNERMQNIVHQAVANPSAFADLLEAVPPSERGILFNSIRALAKNRGAIIGPTAGQIAGSQDGVYVGPVESDQ